MPKTISKTKSKTVGQQLHDSPTHRNGFDQDCPQCLRNAGISGVIGHLEYVAGINEEEAVDNDWNVPRILATEQRRMIGILKLYLKSCKGEPVK